MNEFSFESKNIGEFLVYALTGHFTVSTLVPLRDRVLKDTADKKIFFAFDLSGLTAIDSSAMGMLINLQKKTNPLRGQVVLFSAPPAIQSNLIQAGIGEILPLLPGETEFRENFLL